MAGHPLIEQHLATLTHRLPAAVADELADGLLETYQHHLTRGVDPTTAAEAAITEFGNPDQIIDSFTQQAPGRHAAVRLLATGPVFAACWGPSLLLGRAMHWPVPTATTVLFGLTLLGVAATLAVAATSRHDYRRTRLAAPAGIGLVLLDTTALAAVLFVAPALVWPMAVAIPASLARIAFTIRTLPAILMS